jgi:hypothetical protein
MALWKTRASHDTKRGIWVEGASIKEGNVWDESPPRDSSSYLYTFQADMN